MNQDQFQTLPNRLRRFAAPAVVLLLSLAARLLLLIPGLSGPPGSDPMARIHITGTLVQALIDLPAVVMFISLRMDREWGSGMRQHVIGAGVGLGLAALTVGLKFLLSGTDQVIFMRGVPAFTQWLEQASPWKFIGGATALLAYGPGEALWVAYFMLSFDRILGSQEKRSWLTWGVIIGAVLWALPHLLNASFFGLASAITNTIKIFVIGLLLGVAMRGSKSWVAPMIYWTLTNGTP